MTDRRMRKCTALSLITSILSEIAADVLLAPLAARLSSVQHGDAAEALHVPTAITSGSAAHDEWAPERGLVGGGLTFNALAAARGDAAAASVATRAAALGSAGLYGVLDQDQAVLAAAVAGRPRPATAPSHERTTTTSPGKPSTVPPIFIGKSSSTSQAPAVAAATAAIPSIFDTSIPPPRFSTADIDLRSLSTRALAALSCSAVAPLAGALLRGLIAELRFSVRHSGSYLV